MIYWKSHQSLQKAGLGCVFALYFHHTFSQISLGHYFGTLVENTVHIELKVTWDWQVASCQTFHFLPWGTRV